MKCPTCPDSTLVMADRSGIEIDYCPTCRGVWLDRGELDKIIERNAVAAAPVAAAPVAPAPVAAAPVAQAPYPGGNSKYHSKYHSPPYKKKKSSMLGDLFDF
jgi:Zn-finger nucleic acid-binding protein